jgi:hypothetical protein
MALATDFLTQIKARLNRAARGFNSRVPAALFCQRGECRLSETTGRPRFLAVSSPPRAGMAHQYATQRPRSPSLRSLIGLELGRNAAQVLWL